MSAADQQQGQQPQQSQKPEEGKPQEPKQPQQQPQQQEQQPQKQEQQPQQQEQQPQQQEQQPQQQEQQPQQQEQQPQKQEQIDENTPAPEIAKKLTAIVDQANDRIAPILSTMSDHFTRAEADQKNDNLDEGALVKAVKPLLEQATNILKEAHGGIRALDPDGQIANNASRKASDHEASKEEQHLAESLGKLTGDVAKAVEDGKKKIEGMPKAKKDLGPLLDMVQDPLFQIVSGVGLLLNGVLALVGNILDGLGLGGIVKGLLKGLGLEKVLKGLGLTGLFKS